MEKRFCNVTRKAEFRNGSNIALSLFLVFSLFFLEINTVAAANPTATISGSTTACYGTVVKLKVKLTGTPNWTITYSDGANSKTVNGITKSPFVFGVSPQSTATYTVTKVTDASGNSAVGNGSAVVKVLPLQVAGPIIGDTEVCAGETDTFYINSNNGASGYKWTLPSRQWSILKGGGGGPTDTLIIVRTGTTTGDISVTVSNGFCNSNASTLKIYSTAHAPRTPGKINGSAKICPSSTNKYSIAAVRHALSYKWAVPSGWVIVSGQGTTSVTITASTSGGAVSVYAVDACGNSPTKSLNVTLHSAPTANTGAAQTINSGNTVTIGGTAVLNHKYSWASNPAGFSSTVSSSTVSPTITSTYTLTETITATGCSKSNSVVITVNSNNPLPVQLTGFEVILSNSTDALLNWQTASELNNNYFSIERSVDGRIWGKIGELPGYGTTENIHSYSYTDMNVNLIAGPQIYYRLNQVDYNGHSMYSKVVELNLTGAVRDNRNKVWYNDQECSVNINLVRNTTTDADIVLTDIRGKTVVRQYIRAGIGMTQMPLNMKGLSRGIYSINITDNTGSFTYKVLKN